MTIKKMDKEYTKIDKGRLAQQLISGKAWEWFEEDVIKRKIETLKDIENMEAKDFEGNKKAVQTLKDIVNELKNYIREAE